MRLVCISDTHALEKHIKVPEGDVLIHAGDLTNVGNVRDVEQFNAWLGTLPHPLKIVIAGNHDYCFEPSELRQALIAKHRNFLHRTTTGLVDGQEASSLLTHCTYLFDSAVEYKGVKFWGSPWQPWFYDWAFNLRRGEEIAAIWEKIPNDTDVLITHGPPHRILDQTMSGDFVGCEALLDRLESLPSIKAHIFGHIHEGYGTKEHNGKMFINASICTVDYRPSNVPIVFDLV